MKHPDYDRYEDLIIECHDNPAYTADLIMKQEAQLTALREAAQAVVDNVCMPMPGDYLYSPIEDVAMNALATLLEKQK